MNSYKYTNDFVNVIRKFIKRGFMINNYDIAKMKFTIDLRSMDERTLKTDDYYINKYIPERWSITPATSGSVVIQMKLPDESKYWNEEMYYVYKKNAVKDLDDFVDKYLINYIPYYG